MARLNTASEPRPANLLDSMSQNSWRFSVKVGDLIKLSQGPYNHFKLKSYTAMLVKKLPRDDGYMYDWLVLTDGRYIALGRQIEQSAKVISEGR